MMVYWRQDLEIRYYIFQHKLSWQQHTNDDSVANMIKLIPSLISGFSIVTSSRNRSRVESTCLATVLVPLFQIHNPILYSWVVIIQADLASDPFFELDPILAGQIRPITIRFKPSTDHLSWSNPIQIIHWQGKNLPSPKQTWISYYRTGIWSIPFIGRIWSALQCINPWMTLSSDI